MDAGTRILPMNDEVAKCFKTIIEERKAPKVEKMVDGYSGFLFLDDELLAWIRETAGFAGRKS